MASGSRFVKMCTTGLQKVLLIQTAVFVSLDPSLGFEPETFRRWKSGAQIFRLVPIIFFFLFRSLSDFILVIRVFWEGEEFIFE